jgi:hypothetical protein
VSTLPQCPDTGLPIIFAGGELRRLGTPPAPAGKPRLFGTFREAGKTTPDVPRSEWRAIDRRKLFSWRLDQKSHGSCTGFSAAAALAKARVLRGLTLKVLSGAFVYSQINGGQDQGSLISDGLRALKNVGTCLESQGGWDKIWANQYGAEERKTAARFRIESAYQVTDYKTLVSGLMLGMIPVFAVQVGSNFDPGRDGVCGFERGPGNHAVHADGLAFVGGGPVLDLPNSWGKVWGDDGRGYVTERHIDGIGYQDCYLVEAPIEDPEEDFPAPVVA